MSLSFFLFFLCFYLCLNVFVYLFFFCLSVSGCQCLSLSAYLCLSGYVFVSFCLCVSLSFSVSLSVYYTHLLVPSTCFYKNQIIWLRLRCSLHKILIWYQPCGTGGTRSPPTKSKMVARGPQNGRQDLERCLPIDFGRFHQLLLNNFFDPHTSSMRKSCNGEKKGKELWKTKC